MGTFVYKVNEGDVLQIGDPIRALVSTDGNISAAGAVGGDFVTLSFENVSSSATTLALSVTKQISRVTSTGAHAGTLADGTIVGQIKEIYMVADGGDFTVTPAHLQGALTTLTFGDVGDYIKLIWDGTDWLIVQNSGVVAA